MVNFLCPIFLQHWAKSAISFVANLKRWNEWVKNEFNKTSFEDSAKKRNFIAYIFFNSEAMKSWNICLRLRKKKHSYYLKKFYNILEQIISISFRVVKPSSPYHRCKTTFSWPNQFSPIILSSFKASFEMAAIVQLMHFLFLKIKIEKFYLSIHLVVWIAKQYVPRWKVLIIEQVCQAHLFKTTNECSQNGTLVCK